MKTYLELINEDKSSDNIDKLLKEVKELQDKMIDLKSDMRSIYSSLRKLPHGNSGEKFYRYIIGHFEPLIDGDHEWLTKSTNLDDIIEDLEDYKKSEEAED